MEIRHEYLTRPENGWDGLILIGVGEAGNYLIQKLLEIWNTKHPFFRWIVLVDPDRVEPRNPSFRAFGIHPAIETKKVLAVAGLISGKLKWRTFIIQERPSRWPDLIGQVRRRIPSGTGFVLACPFAESPDPMERWTGLPDDILVVEATDQAEMQRIPGVHFHTGLLSNPPDTPAWQIYVGRSVLKRQPPHPPDQCAQMLSMAAQRGAERLAKMISSGKIEYDFGQIS